MVLGYHNFSNNFTCHWHLEFKIPLSNWLTDHSSFGLDWICHDVTNRLTSLQQWCALKLFLPKSIRYQINSLDFKHNLIDGHDCFWCPLSQKLMHIATKGSPEIVLLNIPGQDSYFNAVGRVMCHSSVCVPWGENVTHRKALVVWVMFVGERTTWWWLCWPHFGEQRDEDLLPVIWKPTLTWPLLHCSG